MNLSWWDDFQSHLKTERIFIIKIQKFYYSTIIFSISRNDFHAFSFETNRWHFFFFFNGFFSVYKLMQVFCLLFTTKLQAAPMAKSHRVRWPLIFSSIMSFRLLFIFPTKLECFSFSSLLQQNASNFHIQLAWLQCKLN